MSSSSNIEGKVLDAAGAQDAATRHAEGAKLPIGRTVYVADEEGVSLYAVELTALATADSG